MNESEIIAIIGLIALFVLYLLNQSWGNRIVNSYLSKSFEDLGVKVSFHRGLTIMEVFRYLQKIHIPVVSSYALLFVEPRTRSRHYRLVELLDETGNERLIYIEVKVLWNNALEMDTIDN